MADTAKAEQAGGQDGCSGWVAKRSLSRLRLLEDLADPVDLLGGMNAEVEVISAESRDTLIVPLQALRELGSDQYAVFVVQSDGEMALRPVEVGLMDFVNAEIISGLKLGEIVSMGVEESTETGTPEQMMPPGGNPMMRFLGG